MKGYIFKRDQKNRKKLNEIIRQLHLICYLYHLEQKQLKGHEEICNNHDICHIEMPNWVEKILKYNSGEKSLKAPFALYLNLSWFRMFIQRRTIFSKQSRKILHNKKKLRMNFLVGQCLQNVHSIKKKINLIITEETIVLKNYVKS